MSKRFFEGIIFVFITLFLAIGCSTNSLDTQNSESTIASTALLTSRKPKLDLLTNTHTPEPTIIPPTLEPTKTPIPTNTFSPTPLPTPTPTNQYKLFEDINFDMADEYKLVNFGYICDGGVNSLYPGLEIKSVDVNKGDYCTIVPKSSFWSTDWEIKYEEVESISKVEMVMQINDISNSDGANPAIGFIYQCGLGTNSPSHGFWIGKNEAFIMTNDNFKSLSNWGTNEEYLERIISADFSIGIVSIKFSNPSLPVININFQTCNNPRNLSFGIYYFDKVTIVAEIHRISIFGN